MLNQRNIPFTEKIAVIDAGPSGMTCAYYLAEKGYPVTVFDRNPVPGGMLMLGIPSFRLEKEVVNAETEILRAMGVKFQCGVEVGKDVTIAQLREQGYRGFYVSSGAQKSTAIRCIGCGVCTTRCEFDAIHLRRDHLEATKMIRSEDKMKAILPYMVKRAARIKVKELRSKRS